MFGTNTNLAGLTYSKEATGCGQRGWAIAYESVPYGLMTFTM